MRSWSVRQVAIRTALLGTVAAAVVAAALALAPRGAKPAAQSLVAPLGFAPGAGVHARSATPAVQPSSFSAVDALAVGAVRKRVSRSAAAPPPMNFTPN